MLKQVKQIESLLDKTIIHFIGIMECCAKGTPMEEYWEYEYF